MAIIGYDIASITICPDLFPTHKVTASTSSWDLRFHGQSTQTLSADKSGAEAITPDTPPTTHVVPAVALRRPPTTCLP